ncbi:MAG TPA: ATP synthase subunit I [Pyrinomonadaceae bacterium]|nr:ATP synthase subunit I [Pyrinomonadaceae bacterium]
MKPTTESEAKTASQLDARLFRTMVIAVASAAVICLSFTSWRVSVGLLLGGALSLLNLHWMRSSIAAGLNLAINSGRPQFKLAQYVLRYFVIGIVVFAAYKLNLVSLPATIVGLCSFVVALFVEAFREFYKSIIHREEPG